jgi:ABC-type amino acid transport system permease subunit
MVELESEPVEKIWKTFLKRHWNMLAVFITAAVIAVIGAVFVFLWFVGDAQATDLVPKTLNLWSMGYLITFILHILFWEIVLIGIPVIVFIIVVYLFWWKKFPIEERDEYRRRHLFGKSSRRRDGSGAVTFLINIGFIIKVYVDGNWSVPFAKWTFDYLVYSYLWVIIWIVVIFGIPLTIGAVWWIHRWMKKNP